MPRSQEVGPRRVTSRSCCYHSVQELDREHSKAHNCAKPQGISEEPKCSCSAVQRPDLEGKGCQSASARESQLSLHGWHQAQAAEGTESAAKPPAPLPVWFWTPGQSPELSLIGNARGRLPAGKPLVVLGSSTSKRGKSWERFAIPPCSCSSAASSC